MSLKDEGFLKDELNVQTHGTRGAGVLRKKRARNLGSMGLDLRFPERAELSSGTKEDSGFSVLTLSSVEHINLFKTQGKREATGRNSDR